VKSYLSLIAISAKVHKRQNRMTILCIIISVLLVTTIFSVSDMIVITESYIMTEKHGNWHIKLEDINNDTAEKINKRTDVKAVGWLEVFNSDADKPYYIGEKRATLYGTDKTYIAQLVNGIEEGNFPQNDNEVMLSSNAKKAINVQIGSRVTINTPAGDTDFTISGFGSDDESYYKGQTYLIGVYMTQNTFADIMSKNGIENSPSFYVQFQNAEKAANAIPKLKAEYNLEDDNISENTAVMGISGKSENKTMKNFYSIAMVLFILVLLAGVLMISGSMNSNVVQRIQFFGMMRCIGASRQQVIKFVRLEALNWCKTAVPIGMILGTAISWGICAILHFVIGGEFAATPVFKVSTVGLVSGAIVGVITVLIAAQSPAKHAAKISPMAAVSGNIENIHYRRRTLKFPFSKIERILGIYHAAASKKNWFLMTASFALSIIMFLCFSVGMDFAHALLPSLRSWQPDVTINGYSNALILDRNLTDKINTIPGVAHTFGSSYIDNIPATSSKASIKYINIVSYDKYMLECAKKSAVQGNFSKISENGNNVMTIYNKNNPLRVGDTIKIGETELEVSCALSDGLFASDLIVICPEETFDRLMGKQKYNLIGIQLNKMATDETVNQIGNIVTGDAIFSDERDNNQKSNATYWTTRVIGYGFLAIIAMITMFNIINSISMSVSAKTKQYGTMRAIGMDGKQLTAMITAEAFTYAISGLLVGCIIGIPLSRCLYIRIITHYFGNEWRLPITLLVIIFIFVFVSATIAVYAPAKRIRNTAITETINEL